MPLPESSSLPLYPPPQPGDPMPTIPKAAFLVRVPEDILLALQEFPKKNIELDYGGLGHQKSTLYIGEHVLPMKAEEEKKAHELYMRSHDPRKAPSLKYYGAIHGKFIVERELDEKIEDRVRHRTQAAEKERTERKVMTIDAVPNGSTKPKKKKKEPTMFIAKKPASAATEPRRDPPPISQGDPSRAGPSRISASIRAKLRYCLVHLIAIQSRSTDFVLRLVEKSSDAKGMKEHEIMELLAEIAERPPDKPNVWRLKTQTWLEVKPWGYPKLREQHRNKMSSDMRAALKALRISQDQEVWQRLVRPSTWVPDAPEDLAKPPANASTDPLPKRPIMSDTKQKKAKASELAKKRGAEAIIAKDEGARVRPDVSGKGKQREDPGAVDSVRPSARKVPGSGFKVKTVGSSATPPITDSSSRRAAPVEPREIKREAPPAARIARSPLPPPSEHDSKPSPSPYASKLPKERIQKKSKPSSSQTGAAESDRERTRDVAPSATKRKKLEDDVSDFSERDLRSPGLPKRPKIYSDAVPGPRSLDSDWERESDRESRKPRNLGLPPKPVMRDPSPLGPNHVKIKKEPSPVPRSLPPRPPGQPQERQHIPSSSSSTSTSRSEQQRSGSTSKVRRPSPKFTSSEDEASTPPKESELRAKARITHLPVFVRRASLPRERFGLKRYWREVYVVYSALFSEHAARSARAEAMMEDIDAASDDGDIEMDDVEDLTPDVSTAFMEVTTAVLSELTRIRTAWLKLGGAVDSSSGNLAD
ncbi:hypothetical protein CERSUDRAFT_113941 [Gelatoporia subvermispora B]|uniref:RNA polymerase II elongation factor ELL N-terminal domain-containing protein n=1 Tax=Ceriporiopsis subvermispora (strain B) TaxID=914234 RepID=M2REN7_CERS8|nr:hypothetical protein CERSUDRAFT_113941 [Gelatoporia subvermispora B]